MLRSLFKILIAFILLFLSSQFTLFSQTVPVPFRVGTKFGVSDPGGKMLISPEFDWIMISPTSEKALTGYKNVGNVVLSSLIYNNRILLHDQKYSQYIFNNGLFEATAFEIVDAHAWRFLDRFKRHVDLFNVDGKKILEGSYIDIGVVSVIDDQGKLDEVLVSTTDAEKKFGLLLYSKKAKRVVKSFFSKSKYQQFTDNSTRNYRDKSVTFIFEDEKGNSRQLLIRNNGTALQLVSNTAITLDHLIEKNEDNRHVPEFPPPPKFESTPRVPKDSISTVINGYDLEDYQHYYLPKRMEQLENRWELLNGDLLVITHGKRGIKNENTGKFILPPVYDDINKGEFVGDGGYITKLNGKYGICFYLKNTLTIDKPIFDKIPLVISSYFNDGSPLIKLYDDTGRFFCYANRYGKIYYTEK